MADSKYGRRSGSEDVEADAWLWDHFEEETDNTVTCMQCQLNCNYNIAAMKKHLNDSHPDGHTSHNEAAGRDGNDDDKDVLIVSGAAPASSSRPRQLVRSNAWLWKHFKEDKNDAVKCVYCQINCNYKDGNTAAMRNHLVEIHPDVRTPANVTSDADEVLIVSGAAAQPVNYSCASAIYGDGDSDTSGPQAKKSKRDDLKAAELNDGEVSPMTSLAVTISRDNDTPRVVRTVRLYVWQHFVNVTIETAKCRHCMQKFNCRNGDTTEMRKHLDDKHQDEWPCNSKFVTPNPEAQNVEMPTLPPAIGVALNDGQHSGADEMLFVSGAAAGQPVNYSFTSGGDSGPQTEKEKAQKEAGGEGGDELELDDTVELGDTTDEELEPMAESRFIRLGAVWRYFDNFHKKNERPARLVCKLCGADHLPPPKDGHDTFDALDHLNQRHLKTFLDVCKEERDNERQKIEVRAKLITGNMANLTLAIIRHGKRVREIGGQHMEEEWSKCREVIDKEVHSIYELLSQLRTFNQRPGYEFFECKTIPEDPKE